jgi:hypothetical protein
VNSLRKERPKERGRETASRMQGKPKETKYKIILHMKFEGIHVLRLFRYGGVILNLRFRTQYGRTADSWNPSSSLQPVRKSSKRKKEKKNPSHPPYK